MLFLIILLCVLCLCVWQVRCYIERSLRLGLACCLRRSDTVYRFFSWCCSLLKNNPRYAQSVQLIARRLISHTSYFPQTRALLLPPSGERNSPGVPSYLMARAVIEDLGAWLKRVTICSSLEHTWAMAPFRRVKDC